VYAFIHGQVEEKYADSIVVNVNGIGYHIYTTMATLDKVKKLGETMRFYTYLYIREDTVSLFGFASREEKAMFEKLITVSGIGPKGALSILSTLSVSQLALAIVTGDINSLTKVPGIGKKTAQRLALELKERIDNSELMNVSESVIASADSCVQEAINALIALGYSSTEAVEALEGIKDSTDKVEEMVVLALKRLDR